MRSHIPEIRLALCALAALSLSLLVIPPLASAHASAHASLRSPSHAASHAAGPPGDASTWNMIFSDDFAGTNFDTSKWLSCYGWGGCTNGANGELEWYTKDNVSVQNGVARLIAHRQTIQGSDGKTYDYTAGMLCTTGKFSLIYGYMEARLKIPKGKGLWPAFWLDGVDTWPPEIDAMEILGNDPSTIYMTTHWSDTNGPTGDTTAWSGVDFSADYHTIGVDWEPNSIVWYIDGVPRKQFTDTAKIPTTRQSIILNLAVGGFWPGSPDASTSFPAEYDITYVHVWQHGANGGGGAAPTTTGPRPTAPQALSAAPTKVTATAQPGQVVVNWAPVAGATSYNLYRATTPHSEGATPFKRGLGGTTFTNTSVTDGATYYYQVTAVNAAGESDKSVEVSAQPLATTSTSTPSTAASASPSGGTDPSGASAPSSPALQTPASSGGGAGGLLLGLGAAALLALATGIGGVAVALRRRKAHPAAEDDQGPMWDDDDRDDPDDSFTQRSSVRNRPRRYSDRNGSFAGSGRNWDVREGEW